MDRHEVAQELAKPLSLELLGSSIPARLAYVGTDDAPRVIPIAFQWTGEHVVMGTVPTSAKVRALRQRPRVAITIDTQDQWPPRVLLIRVADAHAEHYRALTMRKFLVVLHGTAGDDRLVHRFL